jgi:hypothetical protein
LSIPVEQRLNALTVPIEAVPPGETNSVYAIRDDGSIEERQVSLGLETPTKCEVLSGLNEGELVLTGSRSQFRPGQKVVPKLNDSLAQK